MHIITGMVMIAKGEGSNACEKEALLVDDEASEEASHESNEFAFPWLLISAIRAPRRFFGQNSPLFKPRPLFARLLEHVALVTFVLSAVTGYLLFNDCAYTGFLGPLAAVQGCCGLVVVGIHFLALIFR